MKITIIAGARPNFMKVAPVIAAFDRLREEGGRIEYRLVHTGQHFDKAMSENFFIQLGLPEPDVNLDCGGGTQAEQTAKIMVRFESELLANPADLVIVVGDVTSTMACAIVAKKLNTKVAHIEAGIRSGDYTMPEEINRIVTDSISDYFFTTTDTAGDNLRALGTDNQRIFLVGNTMIDTLLRQLPRLRRPPVWHEARLAPRQYIVLPLHRPSNVDDGGHLHRILTEILAHCRDLPVIFPVHPRTLKMLGGRNSGTKNLLCTEPMSYLEFNFLVKNAKAVITDSGGITEETTVMGVPCMTLRDTTERPETCSVGTNVLIGTDPRAIRPALDQLFSNSWKRGGIPELWDGKAADRIAAHLTRLFPDILGGAPVRNAGPETYSGLTPVYEDLSSPIFTSS